MNPGARLRQGLRDMLAYVTREVDDPQAKLEIARSFLAQEIEAWRDGEVDESAMKAEARRVLERAPGVLYHDELAENYAPQMLTDVVQAAREAGLEYVSDAQPAVSQEALFPSDALAGLHERASGDWVRFEQLSDFRVLRCFRYSIFCPSGGVDRRREAARLLGLWAGGELKVVQGDPDGEDGAEFKSGPINLRTNDPRLAEFLTRLADVFPLRTPVDPATHAPLADRILHLWVRRAIELHTAPPPLVSVPGERPTLSPLARFQAANGETLLATLRHSVTQVDEPSVRAIVPLIDGTRTHRQLAQEVARLFEVPVAEAPARLEEILANFATNGLLAA